MFPVKHRVPRECFKKILIEGQKVSSGLFLMRKKQNNLDFPRFSAVVSKKVSKSAVRRNQIKKRFMHALRENALKYSNSDHVVLASPKSNGATFLEISKALENVL